jgi:hypothetical protein
MTRHRTQFVREGSGYNFNGPKARALKGKLSLVTAQNAKRVPCSICGIGILPGAMQAHTETVHGDDQ